MDNLEAILWINEKKCRIIVKNNGNVIDCSDEWNNRASAELLVMGRYPGAKIRFIRNDNKHEIFAANQEWNVSALGNG